MSSRWRSRPSSARVPVSDRRWRRIVVAGALAAVGVSLLGYPYLIERALARFGVRSVCAAALGLGVASFTLGRGARGAVGVAAWPALAIGGVLGLGLWTGERDALLLVPAFFYFGLAETFRASLAREDSIIERCARWLVPQTPEFVRSYCRKLTGFWVVFFALTGALTAILALAGAGDAWHALTGWGIYASMLLVSAAEFFVRKTWFRYYFHDGAFDRLWARLFPAENTEQGRRSAAYIRRVRERMAQDAAARG
jgi:uncharacterized membrane protein